VAVLCELEWGCFRDFVLDGKVASPNVDVKGHQGAFDFPRLLNLEGDFKHSDLVRVKDEPEVFLEDRVSPRALPTVNKIHGCGVLRFQSGLSRVVKEDMAQFSREKEDSNRIEADGEWAVHRHSQGKSGLLSHKVICLVELCLARNYPVKRRKPSKESVKFQTQTFKGERQERGNQKS